MAHAAKGYHRHLGMLREKPETARSEYSASGVRTGREYRRKEHGVGLQPVREPDFAEIVSGCEVQEAGSARPKRARRTVNTIRSPLGGRECAV